MLCLLALQPVLATSSDPFTLVQKLEPGRSTGGGCNRVGGQRVLRAGAGQSSPVLSISIWDTPYWCEYRTTGIMMWYRALPVLVPGPT